MDFTPGAVSSELLTSRMSAPVTAAAAMFSAETKRAYPSLADRTEVYARRGGFAD